ncbi:unnamed protein product, partial [Symbiodinium sp. KB8]
VVRAVANDPDDRGPSDSGVIMPADCELALFCHNDVLSFLAVSLLIVPSAHFVDAFITMQIGGVRTGPRNRAPPVFLFVRLHLLAGVDGTVDPHCGAHDQFDCLMCFVDNTAAEHALSKRNSKNPALCWLIDSCWLWVAEQGLLVNFQRVTSRVNLSDEVFRGDFSKADDLGCQRLEPSFEKIWPDLLRLQEAPADWAAWDYQAIVDSLFA